VAKKRTKPKSQSPKRVKKAPRPAQKPPQRPRKPKARAAPVRAPKRSYGASKAKSVAKGPSLAEKVRSLFYGRHLSLEQIACKLRIPLPKAKRPLRERQPKAKRQAAGKKAAATVRQRELARIAKQTGAQRLKELRLVARKKGQIVTWPKGPGVLDTDQSVGERFIWTVRQFLTPGNVEDILYEVEHKALGSFDRGHSFYLAVFEFLSYGSANVPGTSPRTIVGKATDAAQGRVSYMSTGKRGSRPSLLEEARSILEEVAFDVDEDRGGAVWLEQVSVSGFRQKS
jgi:hypothetical protein